MTIRVRPVIATSMLTVALLVAGCGDGGGEGDETPSTEPTTQATEPALTAPPTQTPEEEAEAAIKQTFATLIADWDDYRTNASEYGTGSDTTWNVELVGGWNADGQANAELANWVGAWRKSDFEQVGDTVVATHDVAEVVPGQRARSRACLDMTGLTYQTYDGQPANLPAKPSQYQTWDMTWQYYGNPSPDAGIEELGWYVFSIELAVDEPC